jgi:hypothetical protein
VLLCNIEIQRQYSTPIHFPKIPTYSPHLLLFPNCFCGYNLFQCLLSATETLPDPLNTDILFWVACLSACLFGKICFLIFAVIPQTQNIKILPLTLRINWPCFAIFFCRPLLKLLESLRQAIFSGMLFYRLASQSACLIKLMK